MASKRKASDVSAEADMTPMIDMTFQLIAFFMVLINFAEDQQDQDIKLPSSQLAKPPEGPIESAITLQITGVDTDGDRRLDSWADPRVIFAGETHRIPDMRPVLLREVQVLTREGKSPKQAHVIIRADGRTPTGKVQDLIKLCQDKSIGFEQFSLRAKQEEAKY